MAKALVNLHPSELHLMVEMGHKEGKVTILPLCCSLIYPVDIKRDITGKREMKDSCKTAFAFRSPKMITKIYTLDWDNFCSNDHDDKSKLTRVMSAY